MYPTLYLNENINPALGKILSALGIHSVHTLQVGNKQVSDDFQLAYAAEHNYIVLTHNRWDFRKLHEEWMKRKKYHSGIIVIGNGELEHLSKRIVKFFKEKYPYITPPFCEVPPQIEY